MLLLIDNYDSFTHNLAHYFIELGQEVQVVRNDEISCTDIENINPEYLVLSPGPCTPNQAGITLQAIKQFAGKIPILGVCLGHQAIGQVFGASVINAQQVRHGKTSKVFHQLSDLFEQVASPFQATRYHSLLLDINTIPDCFNITAWCNQSEIEELGKQSEVMAIEHKFMQIYGVQFHPESLLTEFGHKILKNFLNTGLKLN
ncbi:aminodeoxychorismate/anthranilate synthase component II [Paraglaciecola aquimarina]|uniref:Aminodeoxychorismate/anthranilate synthase component II n=1 Tax=Paraglaciecola algarum TaxID=3050085 RepID=A0ABS9D3V5_9ALTE|nr:aminodeoxychorismate/anthranilate synthase component II [Paraglaciecola sp. G1-23]MCF2947622.1 aminodeoxychorismate/anthranilate synthase component II [Paraglaciecola sp. G1-23]